MKYIAGFLSALIISGTVTAVTVERSLVPAVTSIISHTIEEMTNSAQSLDWETEPTPALDWSIFEGFLLGLQTNSDNTQHQCYLGLQTLKDNVYALPDYKRAISGESSSTQNTNTIADALFAGQAWFQPGTYFKLFKRLQELSGIYFDLYDKCYLEDLIISVGRTLNSFSGGFNTAATVITQGLSIFNFEGEVTTAETTTDFDGYSYGLKMARLIEGTENPTSAHPTRDFGMYLGKIFTKFFNIQVPDVQYQSY